jgi:hypothetical protein
MNSAVNSWNQRAFGTSTNGRSGAVNDFQGRMFGASNSGRGGAVNQYLQTGQSLMQGQGRGGSGGGYSVGTPLVLPAGASFGPMTAANVPRLPRNPFARQGYLPQNQEEENPFGPDEEPQRRPIRGYSQSQGAQRTRTGPLSPRTSYTPTSMLPRSQRYSR